LSKVADRKPGRPKRKEAWYGSARQTKS
jgi:hypothetical protein